MSPIPIKMSDIDSWDFVKPRNNLPILEIAKRLKKKALFSYTYISRIKLEIIQDQIIPTWVRVGLKKKKQRSLSNQLRDFASTTKKKNVIYCCDSNYCLTDFFDIIMQYW